MFFVHAQDFVSDANWEVVIKIHEATLAAALGTSYLWTDDGLLVPGIVTWSPSVDSVGSARDVALASSWHLQLIEKEEEEE